MEIREEVEEEESTPLDSTRPGWVFVPTEFHLNVEPQPGISKAPKHQR